MRLPVQSRPVHRSPLGVEPKGRRTATENPVEPSVDDYCYWNCRKSGQDSRSCERKCP